MLYLHYFFFTLFGISLLVMVLYVPLYAYRFFSRIRDFSNPAIDTASIFLRENKVFLPAMIVGMLSASASKALEHGMNGQPIVDKQIIMFVANSGFVAWFYSLYFKKDSQDKPSSFDSSRHPQTKINSRN